MNNVRIFKHKKSGELMRLIRSRESGVNTFVVVDDKNIPITKKVGWSIHIQEQLRIVLGFDNLQEIK